MRIGGGGKPEAGFVRGLLIALGVGVFLAVSGAFVGGAPSVGHRLLYWLPLMVAGGVWGHVCSRLIDRLLDFDERPWVSVGVLSVVMAVPFSVVVWAVTGPVFGQPVYPLRALPGFLIPVLLVTVALTLINVFVARQAVQTHAPAEGAAARPVRFLDRLPPKLRGANIHAVESEDHYLRIHTDRGSDLILMRLSDALSELEGLEGAQTHRSWWVARDAVRDVARGEGRATFTLDGGVEVPVSRRYAKALRDAGWY
ncbi:MAG: LytTR family DNA-binding domain-containing protein [Brevundimonas sp.]|nr:LytTR family DNA-binding domain-containing protein [Brevundimonas sp.]